MPERPKYLRDLDKARRADIQVGRSDAAYGKHTMSRPWQAYNQMQTMQSQANPDLDRLKAVRRDWNRNLKYTPAGMAVSGVTTPMEAQDAFVRSTEDFRQANKPAYNRMYPLPGNFMDFAEKGGLWGSILSEIAGKTKKRVKDFVAGDGITSIVAGDTPEDKERYITETFGPHLKNVPYGGPAPDVYEGPWPHPEGEPSLIDDESELTREEQIEKLLVDPGIRTDADFLLGLDEDKGQIEDDYYGKSEEGEMVFADEPKDDLFVADTTEDIGPLPFDEGREDFIRRQNEYVTPIPAPLGTPDPHGDFYFDAENWDDTRSDMYIPPLDADQGAFTSLSPFDDSYREKGIMNAMREPYAPREDYTMPFPPRGPHDPFDPDQEMFENRDEYDAWLRRQRLGT